MPTDNDPPKKTDPQPSSPATGSSTESGAPLPVPPGGWTFRRPWLDGTLSGAVQPLDNSLDGRANYLFGNGDNLGVNVLLNTQPWNIDRYGINGDFGIGQQGRLNGSVLRNNVEDTTNYTLGGKFVRGDYFNLNLKDTSEGSLFKGDGKFIVGKGDVLTGSADIDGAKKTSDFKLGGTFDDKHLFNVNYKGTPTGSIFKADGKATVGKDDVLTSSAEIDKTTKTSDFKVGGTFDDKHLFNVNYKETPTSSIFKADGKATIGKDDTLTGSAEIDKTKKTSDFKFNGGFGNGDFFNLNLKNTQAGSVFKGDGQKRIGKGDSLAGGFEINGVEKFSDYRLGAKFGSDNYLNLNLKDTREGSFFKADGKAIFGKGDSLSGTAEIDGVKKASDFKLGAKFGDGDYFNLNFKDTRAGSIFKADGKAMLGKEDALAGSVLIDRAEKISEFKLGGTFANGTSFNSLIGSTPKGVSVGGDLAFQYDQGRGKVALDGKYSPSMSELGGRINYKAKDLEYSGNVRFDDQSGKFGLSKLGANVAYVNNRHKLNFEANWKPQTKDYSVGVTYTFSFGGGSRRSASVARETEAWTPPPPSRPIESPVQRDQKSIEQLGTQGRRLYDQAAAGVEKLNAQGANLPVRETAAALAMIANEKGLTKIDQVFMGNPDGNGKRGLFVTDGDPDKPQTRSASMDRDLAATTSVQFSVAKINQTCDAIQQNGAGAQGVEQQVSEAIKRGI